MALAHIELTLDAYAAGYSATMQEFKDRELKSLNRQIRDGLDSKAVLDPTSGVFRYRKQAGRRMTAHLDQVKSFGRVQVGQELDRQ